MPCRLLVHIGAGLILVLSLWTLALLGLRARVSPAIVVIAILWGLLVPVLGLTQTRLLVGDLHWVIQVLHLVVGISAIGQAEALGQRIRRAPVPAV